MKHRILAVILALSILMSVTYVFADGVDKVLISVDGTARLVRAIDVDGTAAFSVRDLASFVGAKAVWNQQNQTVTVTKEVRSVVFKMNSNEVIVNGQKEETEVTTAAEQGLIFVDINVLLEALGCDVEQKEDEIIVSTTRLLKEASSPKWLAGNRILVSTISDEGVAFYAVDNRDKSFAKVIDEKANAVDVSVSHDGVYVAYVNDQGAVYVVNTFNDRTTQISKDTATKSDLQWGPQNDRLYYLAGEKSNVIAQMNVADGKVTVLNDDKVEYKSDLRVSNDGNKLLYAVTKTAVFSDVNGVMNVDTTGTEPQLFVIDLSISGAKPMQLTNNKDYKSSINLLNDGQAIYVGADDTQNSGLDLKIISEYGRGIKTVSDLNALQVQVLSNGRVFALGTSFNNIKAIYEIDPATAKKAPVTIVDDSVVEFTLSKDGTQTVVVSSTEDGDIICLLETKMTKLTK